MNQKVKKISNNNQPSSLHPEVNAEPELGDFRYSNENVVATIELSEFSFGGKAYDNSGITEKNNNNIESGKGKSEPTVAIIPAEDVLPMEQQDKLGGGT
jgi:hypothetical protein